MYELENTATDCVFDVFCHLFFRYARKTPVGKTMRVKHFDPAFKQWPSDKEEGVTFPFVEMGDNYIQFEGLRYELIEGVCYVTLDMKHGDSVEQVGFVYTRN